MIAIPTPRDEPLGFESPFSEEETLILLEAAYMGLFRCRSSLSDRLDINAEHLDNLRDKLQNFLNSTTSLPKK